MDAIPQWLIPSYTQAQQWRRGGSFHHALLITGTIGIGQSVYAEALSKMLLCENINQAPCGQCHSCAVALAGTHPDLLILDGSEGSIKVDEVRQVVAKVSNKPQLGFSKVVMIYEAHQMNINAANAILKALEEPPQSTYFLLTSNSSRALMPTILSRCQRVTLPSPNADQIKQWLQREGSGDVDQLTWYTQAPFQLMELSRSSSAELLQSLPESMQSWLEGHIRVDELVKAVNKDNIHNFLDGLSALIHAALHYSASGQCDANALACVQELLKRYDLYRLMNLSQRLVQLKSQLDKTHLNPTIQLVGELNSW